MGSLANWTELERRGLIPASPGRDEAVQAALESAARKKEAERQAMLAKSPKAKGRK